MSKKLRVAVIFGGRSGEHEVSLVSAKSIMEALSQKKYEVIPIGITKDGEWFGGQKVHQSLAEGRMHGLIAVSPSADPKQKGVYLLKNSKSRFQPIDVAFPVLHGPYGEDGTIQGLLETAGIPYVGCAVFASSACMDKYMAKLIFESKGLPQVKYLHFARRDIEKNFSGISREVAQKIGFPCFVKPSNLGSSVGISKVKKPQELQKALRLAAKYDASIIVEQGIDAREIECSVLGNENPVASVAGEIVPSREFYDYFAKYVDNTSRLFIPARLSAQKTQEVQTLAIRAYTTLQCSGMGRVDFLMDRKSGKLYLNEINTIPGFTSISMYPKLWEASGIPYSKLLDKLIQLALERHTERQSHKSTFESGSDWYK